MPVEIWEPSEHIRATDLTDQALDEPFNEVVSDCRQGGWGTHRVGCEFQFAHPTAVSHWVRTA